MCGVLGVVTTDKAQMPCLDPRRLHHRGPDDRAVAHFNLPWGHLALGATRLSIVDPEGPVPVPGVFRHVDVALSFNGEIYNWRELRETLHDPNAPWETNCDTEVVAHAWRRWGLGMLPRLNGMWALALVDLRTNQVLLTRDRAGEKPLFYTTHNGQLHFASEIKALSVPLVETPCQEQNVLEFDCLDRTPFQGIYRLGPGQRILLSGPEDLQSPCPKTWWVLPWEVSEEMTWDSAVDQTKAILVDAIRIRARNEVPVTALVSGGLDSAIVQTVAEFPQVFCCTFPEDGMDWLPMARLAAPHAEIRTVTFDLSQVLQDFTRIAYHLDTPATWTALCQWFLAREIKASGYKVVLSGEGADELFAGYSRYRVLWWLTQAYWDPQLRNYQALVNLVTVGPREQILATMLDRSPNHCSLEHAADLVRRFAVGKDMVADMARVEWHTTMQCLLRMADRMMAAHSIENRSPFFDYRLIELATRIPTKHKVNTQWSKAVLREVALRLGVNREIVNNPTKVGLVTPWNKWRAASIPGGRGAWDRGDFSRQMLSAWRRAYQLPEVPPCLGS